jgi:hypothetical protein
VGPADQGLHNPKGYGAPWSVRSGHDPTARGHLPQLIGTERERVLGEVALGEAHRSRRCPAVRGFGGGGVTSCPPPASATSG